MKNAHERFGFAEFEKKLRDTSTRIRLTADCFIGERAETSAPSAGHLLSAFGTDVEVAALWAAILTEEPIRVGGQDLKPYMVQFGERPTVYRGTLTVPGRKRPVRHLVVVSTQLSAEGDQARIIVKSNSPDLLLRAVANLHGLANDVAGDGITANAVLPGLTNTLAIAPQSDEQKRATWEQQAIKRLGEPEDMTGAILFLTSDDAAFITGQALVVDGGQYRIG